MNEVTNKIDQLKDRLSLINNCNLSCNSSALLHVKINESIDNINEIIDNFEISNKNEYRINKEIEQRIKDNEQIKQTVKTFAPYILLYQLNSLI